jgi:8-oxo-dGTP diphosphatase
MNKRTHVAVGVIYNSTRDKVLISKRSGNQHLAGYWEFPGGKVESNEGTYAALQRELFEELGINVNTAEAFTSLSHNYPDKKVLLDVWKIFDWSGEPVSRENQDICWVNIDCLKDYSFPDANKYIIQSIQLTPVYVISQDTYEDYSHLFSVAKECFSAGLKLFQLRLKDKNSEAFAHTVETLSELAARHSAKLILNGTVSDINRYNIDGIHLNSHELLKYDERPLNEDLILGASCHNEAELIRASQINVNYAFISPVLFTPSHPAEDPLGWEKFADLKQMVDFPIYALGGMTFNELSTARTYGAYGVAMISAVWDPKIHQQMPSKFPAN